MKIKNESNLLLSAFLEPVRWALPIKLMAIAAACIVVLKLAHQASDHFGLAVTRWGYVNCGVALLIISWYLLDVFWSRRTIYSWMKSEEHPLKIEVRFWRKVVLLTCAFLAIASAGVELLGSPAPMEGDDKALGPIFVLIGAYIASFGWMFTAFEREKADRSAHTSTAVREQLSGDGFVRNYRALEFLVKQYRDASGVTRDKPLPREAMTAKLSNFGGEARLPEEDISLDYAVDQVFNGLNSLAFGVRQGQLEFNTVRNLLRNRLVRLSFVFHYYIEDSTSATMDEKVNQLRSQSLTWEHFLWLASRIELLEYDKIDRGILILPPDYKARRDSLHKAPQADSDGQAAAPLAETAQPVQHN